MLKEYGNANNFAQSNAACEVAEATKLIIAGLLHSI